MKRARNVFGAEKQSAKDSNQIEKYSHSRPGQKYSHWYLDFNITHTHEWESEGHNHQI